MTGVAAKLAAVAVNYPVVSLSYSDDGRKVTVSGSPMLGRAEAAHFLGVSENRLDKLPIIKTGTGARKYHVADLEAYLNKARKMGRL